MEIWHIARQYRKGRMEFGTWSLGIGPNLLGPSTRHLHMSESIGRVLLNKPNPNKPAAVSEEKMLAAARAWEAAHPSEP